MLKTQTRFSYDLLEEPDGYLPSMIYRYSIFIPILINQARLRTFSEVFNASALQPKQASK